MNIVPPVWLAQMAQPDALLRHALNLPPDTRTPDEKAEDFRRYTDRQREAQGQVRAAHETAIAAAIDLQLAIMQMHAPVFSGDLDGVGHCDGCDGGGYEYEAPEFPCRTYRMAEDWRP